MTITQIHTSASCENCTLFITVGKKTRRLASSQGVLLIDGARCVGLREGVVSACLTLFNAEARVDFPFESVAGDILAGNAPTFDISAQVICPNLRLMTVFRDCVPAPPMGLGCARDRWTFRVAPDKDIWDFLIDGGARGGA